MPSNYWAADTNISMPQPLDPEVPPQVDMGGFVFTTKGLAHNITLTQIEDILSMRFAPQGNDYEQ